MTCWSNASRTPDHVLRDLPAPVGHPPGRRRADRHLQLHDRVVQGLAAFPGFAECRRQLLVTVHPRTLRVGRDEAQTAGLGTVVRRASMRYRRARVQTEVDPCDGRAVWAVRASSSLSCQARRVTAQAGPVDPGHRPRWSPATVTVARGSVVKWRGVSKYHDVLAYGGNWSLQPDAARGRHGQEAVPRAPGRSGSGAPSLHADRHVVHRDVRERSGHVVMPGNPCTLLSRSTRIINEPKGEYRHVDASRSAVRRSSSPRA